MCMLLAMRGTMAAKQVRHGDSELDGNRHGLSATTNLTRKLNSAGYMLYMLSWAVR